MESTTEIADRKLSAALFDAHRVHRHTNYCDHACHRTRVLHRHLRVLCHVPLSCVRSHATTQRTRAANKSKPRRVAVHLGSYAVPYIGDRKLSPPGFDGSSGRGSCCGRGWNSSRKPLEDLDNAGQRAWHIGPAWWCLYAPQVVSHAVALTCDPCYIGSDEAVANCGNDPPSARRCTSHAGRAIVHILGWHSNFESARKFANSIRKLQYTHSAPKTTHYLIPQPLAKRLGLWPAVPRENHSCGGQVLLPKLIKTSSDLSTTTRAGGPAVPAAAKFASHWPSILHGSAPYKSIVRANRPASYDKYTISCNFITVRITCEPAGPQLESFANNTMPTATILTP